MVDRRRNVVGFSSVEPRRFRNFKSFKVAGADPPGSVEAACGGGLNVTRRGRGRCMSSEFPTRCDAAAACASSTSMDAGLSNDRSSSNKLIASWPGEPEPVEESSSAAVDNSAPPPSVAEVSCSLAASSSCTCSAASISARRDFLPLVGFRNRFFPVAVLAPLRMPRRGESSFVR